MSQYIALALTCLRAACSISRNLSRLAFLAKAAQAWRQPPSNMAWASRLCSVSWYHPCSTACFLCVLYAACRSYPKQFAQRQLQQLGMMHEASCFAKQSMVMRTLYCCLFGVFSCKQMCLSRCILPTAHDLKHTNGDDCAMQCKACHVQPPKSAPGRLMLQHRAA